MKATSVLAGITAVMLAVALINVGYAYTGEARTYNTGDTNDSVFITVALGDSQYSSAVTSEITYRSDIMIDENGRTMQFIPDHKTSIDVGGAIPVTEVVQFDLTVSKQGSDPMPTYSLTVGVDDTDKMTGTFYISYWIDPSDDNTRVNAAFPGTITINGLTTQSIKLCLFVHADVTIGEPEPPLDDIAFKFRTTVGV